MWNRSDNDVMDMRELLQAACRQDGQYGLWPVRLVQGCCQGKEGKAEKAQDKQKKQALEHSVSRFLQSIILNILR
jgi:hypothetical protein